MKIRQSIIENAGNIIVSVECSPSDPVIMGQLDRKIPQIPSTGFSEPFRPLFQFGLNGEHARGEKGQGEGERKERKRYRKKGKRRAI